MKQKGYGRIVMTTSIAGLFGNYGQTNYSAAKMGIVGFMNSLKLEGEKYSILVNTVAPLAATGLAIQTGIFPKEVLPLLKPDFVASLVAYLCSDQCSTSGDIISAGGGYYAKVQVVEGRGIRFDAAEEVSPETLAEKYDDITNMEGAVPFKSTRDELMVTLSPLTNVNHKRGKENGTVLITESIKLSDGMHGSSATNRFDIWRAKDKL